MAKAKSGGGITGKNVRHGKYGKSEPRPRAISPAAVNQLGNHVGSHVTSQGRGKGDTGYRGEELVRGKGYTHPPITAQVCQPRTAERESDPQRQSHSASTTQPPTSYFQGHKGGELE